MAENVSARWFDLYDLQEYVANPATLAGDLSGKARVFRAYVGAVFEEDRLPGLEEWIPALMEYEDYNTDAWFDGSVATSGDWIEKTSHGAPTNLTSAWGSPRPLGSIYVNEDRPQLDVQSSVDGSEPADLRYIEGPPTISPRVSPPSSSIGTDWERVKRVSAERNIIKSELNSSQESLVSMVRGVTETVRPSLPVNSNNRRSPNGNGLASAANTSFSRSPGVSRGSITVRSSDGGVHLRTLNEMFQRNAIDAPKWDIVSQGPPHNPSFVADLTGKASPYWNYTDANQVVHSYRSGIQKQPQVKATARERRCREKVPGVCRITIN